MTFAEELKAMRTRLGLTQLQVALLFRCDPASIRNYESGRQEPAYPYQIGARVLLAEATAKNAPERA